jgi:hypothetical protein
LFAPAGGWQEPTLSSAASVLEFQQQDAPVRWLREAGVGWFLLFKQELGSTILD